MLSLIAHPHLDTSSLLALSTGAPVEGVRTAQELIGLLEARPLPLLHLSFRLAAHMQLFERIVVLFPVLELFKCTLKSVRGASGRRAAGRFCQGGHAFCQPARLVHQHVRQRASGLLYVEPELERRRGCIL